MRTIGKNLGDSPEVAFYDPISGEWVAVMPFTSMPDLEQKVAQFKAFFEEAPELGLRGTWKGDDAELVFLSGITRVNHIDLTRRYFVITVDGEECKIRAKAVRS